MQLLDSLGDETGHCPRCGEKGNIIGQLVKPIDAGLPLSISVTLEFVDVYACPKCHTLFWD